MGLIENDRDDHLEWINPLKHDLPNRAIVFGNLETIFNYKYQKPLDKVKE